MGTTASCLFGKNNLQRQKSRGGTKMDTARGAENVSGVGGTETRDAGTLLTRAPEIVESRDFFIGDDESAGVGLSTACPTTNEAILVLRRGGTEDTVTTSPAVGFTLLAGLSPPFKPDVFTYINLCVLDTAGAPVPSLNSQMFGCPLFVVITSNFRKTPLQRTHA